MLPIVHFDLNSVHIRKNDYLYLAQVAQLMKDNKNVKIVVTGFTDATGNALYNRMLAYNRAISVIEFLTVAKNIPRNRLILQYERKAAPVVVDPTENLANRRVEFRVALPTDKEMEAP